MQIFCPVGFFPMHTTPYMAGLSSSLCFMSQLLRGCWILDIRFHTCERRFIVDSFRQKQQRARKKGTRHFFVGKPQIVERGVYSAIVRNHMGKGGGVVSQKFSSFAVDAKADDTQNERGTT